MHGGAVYAISNQPQNMTIRNSIFSSNSADDQGGAIYSFHYFTDIQNCTFLENIASKGKGGAISQELNGGTTISNSKFHNNRVTGSIPLESVGGAIFISGSNSTTSTTVSLLNTEFINCRAHQGGCIFLQNTNVLEIRDSIFKKSDSLTSSRILSLSELDDNIFQAPAIYISNITSALIENSSFSNLQSATSAGAILAE
jgi:hypothetical protein